MSLIKRPPILPDQYALYYPPAPPKRGPTGTPVRQFGPPVTLYVGELPGYTQQGEAQAGGALRAQYTTRFITRYRPDFDTKGRLEVAGRTYELVGVSPLRDTYRKTYLVLHAQAVG